MFRRRQELDGASALSDVEAMRSLLILCCVLGSLIASPESVRAETATIAVAANFAGTIRPLAARFRSTTGHELVIVSGSTGKLYAQAQAGAPFDVFLSADREAPARLHAAALADSPFTYAIGKLVLWSKRPGYVDSAGRILSTGSFAHLALANPDLAPYGRAARQFLVSASLWSRLSSRVVLGESVAQAFQFVDSENSELGFVALSQIRDPQRPAHGSHWLVPEDAYDPILQDVTLLARGRKNMAARAFLALLRSKSSCEIISLYGYGCPRVAS